MTKETLSYTVTLALKDGSTTITATDSSTSKAGYKAAVDFKAGNRIEIPVSGQEGQTCTQYIPYDSILHATICTTSTTTTVTDAVCVEE